jgi:transcription termination factor Rho
MERPGKPDRSSSGDDRGDDRGDEPGESGEGARKDYRKADKRRGNSRRGGRRRRKRKNTEEGGEGASQSGASAPTTEAPERNRSNGQAGTRPGRRSRRRRGQGKPAQDRPRVVEEDAPTGTGMFISEKGGFGTLRREENQYIPSKQDIFVAQRLIQRHKLRDGSVITGPVSKGKKYKLQLEDITTIDGRDPKELAQLRGFKSLTSIDPDFHYAVGDVTDESSMRILDIIAPIGRGQRGLIVAAPRTGKTTIMRQFAKGIEIGYPEVHLMVLLVDERPEEATEWVRSTAGKVFVSTSDETPKNHVQLAEAVWKRCQRLVELGEDVVLILDSITRLARAYNNHTGGSGRTMSGGLDSRAMERPRQIFGSARNTETAGSLTILGTTLVETGSRMDQLIFEEFKGTGNMELVLNRKLSDRRIFPSIDIEKSGTRKEEKLISSRRLKRINTLRRVLLKMNFIEAMELLAEKMEDVEKTEDFLARFDVDPEA